MNTGRTLTGIDVFLENNLQHLRGRRIALLSNYAAIDSTVEFSIERLHQKEGLDVRILLAPEHGLWGDYQAGENVPPGKDPKTGLPVVSLYDQSGNAASALPADMDERMRMFDISETGKKLNEQVLEEIDMVIVDIQDIGTRIYTYISTLGFLMEALSGRDISLLILDRPNPVRGDLMEGPVLESPAFISFIGFHSLPLRHGMTIGEIALMFNTELFSGHVDVSVIPMKNWERGMWFEDTRLPWVKPSPNIPSVRTAALYPGMVLLEGTNISEGRGTTTPFEVIGAPWMDGTALARELNRTGSEGVVFRETVFRPGFSKYAGEKCPGISIFVSDRDVLSPFRVIVDILRVCGQLHPGRVRFYDRYFNLMAGNSWLLEMVRGGRRTAEVLERSQPDLSAFSKRREPYLLYK